MSKYQFAESDIYLPGTDIPKNRLGIEAPDLLHEVEATLLQQAYSHFITELDPSVRFNENYFKALHHDTYASLYEWAGLYRTVDMSKGGSLFCRAAYLEQEPDLRKPSTQYPVACCGVLYFAVRADPSTSSGRTASWGKSAESVIEGVDDSAKPAAD